MKLSTQNHFLSDYFGFERSIEILKDVGYDTVDMSLFCMSDNPKSIFLTPEYRSAAEKLKAHADKIGIDFNQAHAAFMYNWKKAGEVEDRVIPDNIRAFEICSILNIKHIVVHPLPYIPYYGHEDEVKALNMKYYRTLEPYAREYGVKIALENMAATEPKWGHLVPGSCGSPEIYIDWFDTLDSDQFVCLLDVGHAAIAGIEPQDFIRALGHDRLKGLHIHDNDYRGDRHALPGMGKFDWEAIMKALSDIDYTGEFTFEADSFLGNFSREFKPEAAAFMAKIGRHLLSRYDYYESLKNK